MMALIFMEIYLSQFFQKMKIYLKMAVIEAMCKWALMNVINSLNRIVKLFCTSTDRWQHI